MNKLVGMTLVIGAFSLSVCGETSEEKAVKETALKICPPGEVLEDFSSYTTEWAEAGLDQTDWFAVNGKRDGVQTTVSGLQYSVNKSGDPKGPHPTAGQTVRVHYHGLFRDGSVFDSSYDRGEDIAFPLNRVIKGWTEGVGLMRPCDAWTLYVPSDLAYGPNGRESIPPATPLIFHVQLIEIK